MDSRSAGAAKRRANWFDMLLKSNIDQNEDHLLGLSTAAVAKKIKRTHQEGQANRIEDMIPDRWSKKIHLYQIDALNGIHDWDDTRKDFFKAEMSNRSSHKMVNENRIGNGNKRLEGRDWSKNEIKRSNEMLEKIDKTLKPKEQLRRLEEYVGGRPKKFDPHTFVRP
ncbi:hypothetical protein Tco_0947430 [Tanacetum coccineum]